MLTVNQMKFVVSLIKDMLAENLWKETDPDKRIQIVEYKNQMEELEKQIKFLEFMEQLEAQIVHEES